MKRKPKLPSQLIFNTDQAESSVSTEEQYLDNEKNRAYEDEELKGRKQDRRERKLYANLTFTLISIWLILIIIIFIAIGKGSLGYPDSVVITLLTTTTTGVVALFVIVAKYLFPSK